MFMIYAIIQSMYQTALVTLQTLRHEEELEFKRMFVRHISHEVRTPLNTAIMGLQVLYEEFTRSFDKENIDTVKEIKKSCDIAVDVLNEFLTFDKLEAGSLMIEKSKVNGYKLVEEVVSPFQVQARTAQITLRVSCLKNGDKMPKNTINVDVNKISQVIRNLVSNGLKFTPEGGTVDITVSVVAGKGDKESMLQVQVTDTGAGISQENQKRLFKEIVQFNPAKLQRGGGSGLGLYISYGIVVLHGGTLTVNSAGEAHGSTFTMTLPISSVTNLSSLKHSSHSRKNVSVLSEGSVFVRAFCRVPSSTFLSSRTLNIRRNSLSVSMTNSVTKKSNSNGWVGRNATMYIRKSLVIGSPKDSLVDSSQFGFPDSPPDCLERSVTLPPAEEPHVNGPLTIDLTASNARPILGGMSSCDSKEDNEGVPDHSDFRTDNSQPTSSNKLKALFKKRASVSPLNGNNNNNNKIQNQFMNIAEEVNERESLEDYRVLVVDDSSMSRKMLCRLLKRRCKSCYEAENGEEAVTKIQSSLNGLIGMPNINLVLIDAVMPILDGYEATKRMRKMGYMGLIIGVSGNVTKEDVNSFMDSGTDGVLPKPLDIESFDILVKRLIRSQSIRRR